MTSHGQIITSRYAKSHNLTAGYHNMAIEYHNFLKRGEIFLSFKILNKKVELHALNMH